VQPIAKMERIVRAPPPKAPDKKLGGVCMLRFFDFFENPWSKGPLYPEHTRRFFNWKEREKS